MNIYPADLHIVEPTLVSEAGHCYSFLKSLVQAIKEEKPELKVNVWAGRGAKLPEFEDSQIRIISFFHRRLRKFQTLFLYRRLLKGSGRIFIQTAGRSDLFLLQVASGGKVQAGRIFLYFHWIRMSPAKAGYFRKTASRQPGFTILCPVQSVSDQFKALGFSRVRSTPYPITPFPTVEGPSEFRHILFAGAARQDKGFHHVVDLAEYMNRNDIMVPFWIQTSPDHYDRYEESTQRDLSRLERIKQPWISIFPQTLGREGYEELYRGGICLQPYRREDFVERISGITLDALSLGCPVIVPGGTWMAGIIDRFGAGITLNRFSSKDLMDAVDAIRTNYHDFRDRALRAGSVLGNEYNARHLLYVLTEGI